MAIRSGRSSLPFSIFSPLFLNLYIPALDLPTTRTTTRPTRSTAAAATVAAATSTRTVRNRDTTARATVRGGSNTPSGTLYMQVQISFCPVFPYAFFYSRKNNMKNSLQDALVENQAVAGFKVGVDGIT